MVARAFPHLPYCFDDLFLASRRKAFPPAGEKIPVTIWPAPAMVRDGTRPATNQEEAFRRVLTHPTMLKVYVHAIVRDPLLAEDTFSDFTLESCGRGHGLIRRGLLATNCQAAQGLFRFQTIQGAVEGLASINSDYKRHSCAAREIAAAFRGQNRSCRHLKQSAALTYPSFSAPALPPIAHTRTAAHSSDIRLDRSNRRHG
ncbi:MAG: hypothetical protein M3463_08160 [Verrucomicrobiota bacterium]|nr:hypothetical protein [Verrucomicrobiota bacterium]